MAWEGIDPAIREVAERVCTAKQLEVMKLIAAGYSIRGIARALEIDRKTVKERVDRATDNINRALEAQQQEDSGV